MLGARDLPLLAVFAAVVRDASFTGAARRLGLSKSAVSESVRLLEERCGARLIERTTRRLRLTEVGSDVFAVAGQVDEAPRSIAAIIEAHRGEPVGALRIASTHGLTGFVAP